ncbi:NAD(P)H-binding protein [Bacillus sp. NEB1478]|uniref:NAD(P)H-binding protein n=1 Tax=Bacillus sp. NEB1478 TaxID=3073816 RepID=UPI002873041F|nr:NAD(P)H-binding protein [Bacillus sp. NEB1478]WNB91923.1 NAD(P)H-binding protein [Bacillus sp. NEB1478]
MKVAVVGASEIVGEYVLKALNKRGYETVAVISEINRKPDMHKLGATEVAVSTEHNFNEVFSECDAVIYISGSSHRAGGNKSVLIDHQEVNDSIRGAKNLGIERFVLMSAVRAHEPENSDLRKIGAKHAPDELLQKEDFKYTIIRPSRLVDKPGTRMIQTGEGLSIDGEISKEDAASVLVEVLNNEAAFYQIIEVTAGKIPIAKAF